MAVFAGYWGPEAILYSSTGVPAKLVPATIRVKSTGVLATLYTDRTKAVVAGNPVMTDTYGNLAFYAEPNEYLVQLAGSTFIFTATVRPDLQEPSVGGVTDHGALTGLGDDDHPQYLTQAEVDARVQLIVGAAPAALDTLQELADALGDDANFAATVTALLAAKAPLASPAFTGTPTGLTKVHVGLGNVDNTTDLAKPLSTAMTAAVARITDPMTKYGIIAANGRFQEYMGQGTFTDQWVYVRVHVPAGESFSRMCLPVRQAGVFTPGSGRPNQLAWWDDNGVLQQVTPNDDAMWTTADWYVANLPANNPAQAVDRWVFAGFSISGMAGAQQYVLTNAVDNGGIPFAHAPGSAKRFSAYNAGIAALGNFDPDTTGTKTSFAPFIGFMT